jgi:putative phosphonate metabolism protein
MTSTRYAIYYAPAPGEPLWRRASAWLGRDAVADVRVRQPVLADFDAAALDRLCEAPRRYGFHATLKAPFALADGVRRADLFAAAEAFATRRRPFDIRLCPGALDAFLALRLAEPSHEMQDLHEACVRGFEALRAPSGAEERARRRRPGLTAAQEAHLAAFGYPFVFDDFRFHMTLTGPIADDAVRTRLLEAMQAHFADLDGPHRVDAITVFVEETPAAMFRVAARFPFQG